MSYLLRDGSGSNIAHKAGSVVADLAVNRRGTMAFRAEKDTVGGALPVAIGEEVYLLTAGAAKIWGGTVESIDEGDLTEGSRTYRALSYTAVDFDQLATKRLVVASYESQVFADIVADIVTTTLAAEGVSVGTVDTGPVITKAVFNYRTAAEVLDELAGVTGFSWWIDADLALQFRSPATLMAPWSITALYKPYRNLTIRRSRYLYRNAQYVRAGIDLGDAGDEILSGDGTRRTFTVSLPVGTEPTITIDTGGGYGAAKTVGVNGVDSGKAWYYNIGRTEVTQAGTETVLATTHKVKINYRPQYPIIVRVDDAAEQAARATAEGIGTGIYEHIVDSPDIDDRALAIDNAESLLRRYGETPTTVTFETDVAGLEAGQLIGITLTDHDLSGDWLIERVRIQARADNELRYSVTCVSNEAVGGWQEYYRRQAQARRSYVIRENEVLIILAPAADAVALADEPTVTEYTGAYTVDGADTYINGFHVG